ncbi:hypothetical protein CAI16_19310 [Virgibacillus dokdonensis]|uniref:Nitroreductase domain-containing protein n=1 Tax=Virgibacillus dokdonensis TaxID=302167 RepID=A0A3E0WHQ7_9BACI|nr:SagB/ThcOx family dehydrogenase [Virgibacillus dokdonensis]RFA31979.1 hypothetical protein CAI16_19310 [Virgibacillus dokdonensis]
MLVSLEEKLITHSGVRIFFKNNNWEIVNLFNKSVLRVDYKVCIVLITFMNGHSIESSYREINNYFKLDRSDFNELVKTLKDKELIVDENNDSHIWTKEIINSWDHYGWRKAADFHLLTYDYPFLDYRDGGRESDIDIMKSYSDMEPDKNRGKKYPANKIQREIKTPKPVDILKELNISFDLNKAHSLSGLDPEKVSKLMSLCFGVLRRRKVSNSEKREDLVRKISPSGGSRHPSEGYLFNTSIDSLDKGIYHFSSISSTLDYIGDLPDEKTLSNLFPGPSRANFKTEAFIVITSLFERNMYRYREPRTFRTIYMDIGHIVENIHQICKHMGINSFQHQGIDDAKVEQLLDVNYLEEGAIIGIAIGGNNE